MAESRRGCEEWEWLSGNWEWLIMGGAESMEDKGVQ